jgi:hypothetical protein
VGYIERECVRIEAALQKAEPDGIEWKQLHAAQQALKWTTEPQGFAAPLDSILSSGQAITGSLPEPEDYLDAHRPLQSLDICAPDAAQ